MSSGNCRFSERMVSHHPYPMVRTRPKFLVAPVTTLMKITLPIGCVLVLAVAGCKPQEQSSSFEAPTNQSSGIFPGQSAGSPAPTVSEWAKIKIDRTGAVFVNKKQMTADEFKTECARLKKVSGAAVLFVDAANHVASSAQANLIRHITDAGVPMKLALKESELE